MDELKTSSSRARVRSTKKQYSTNSAIIFVTDEDKHSKAGEAQLAPQTTGVRAQVFNTGSRITAVMLSA